MISNFYNYSQSTIISLEFVDFWPKVYLILYPSFWKLDNPSCHIVYWTYLSNKSKVPIIQYTYINEIHFYKKVDNLLCHILKLLNSNFFSTISWNISVQLSVCPDIWKVSFQTRTINLFNQLCLPSPLFVQTISPHVQRVSKGRRRRLWSEILIQIHTADAYLIVSPRSPTP